MVKVEEDFSKQTEKAIAEAQNILNNGSKNLIDAIEHLLVLEKQTRLAEDTKSTSAIAVQIVKMCVQVGDWKNLNNYIVIISKKRGQIKTAIKNMVVEAITYLDRTPDKETKLELIATLRTVTEGKIFVEVERANLTRILAKIREEEGKISEAADIIQEVQVETVGSMERREKIDFILEQVRLCLDKKDYVRANLISQKISKRSLSEEEIQDLKIRYHNLMIRYFTHLSQYLDNFLAFQAIYNTPSIQKDQNQWSSALQNQVIYLVMSPFDDKQYDFMNITNVDKKLEELPALKELLQSFIDNELIVWPVFETKFDFLKNHQIFTDQEHGKSRWEDLHKRVIEHDIRVVAKYYSKIQLKRLAELLNLDEKATEKYILDMVTSKMLYAKIDRIDGIISFLKPKDTNDTLNEWSSDVSKLLNSIEKTCHLINKEIMVQKAKRESTSMTD